MKISTQENNTLKTKLQEMLETERVTLKREVIEEVLNYDSDEEIECFLRDITSFGCANGTIGKLSHCKDTHAFYNKYYDEIEQLRVAYLQNTGEELNVGNRDWKNTLAWFGFEETSYQLASELGI